MVSFRPKQTQRNLPVSIQVNRRTPEEESAYVQNDVLKDDFLEIIEEKDIAVNGFTGREISYINTLVESKIAKMSIFTFNNNSYVIGGMDDYFDQILSTFKFIIS